MESGGAHCGDDCLIPERANTEKRKGTYYNMPTESKPDKVYNFKTETWQKLERWELIAKLRAACVYRKVKDHFYKTLMATNQRRERSISCEPESALIAPLEKKNFNKHANTFWRGLGIGFKSILGILLSMGFFIIGCLHLLTYWNWLVNAMWSFFSFPQQWVIPT